MFSRQYIIESMRFVLYIVN